MMNLDYRFFIAFKYFRRRKFVFSSCRLPKSWVRENSGLGKSQVLRRRLRRAQMAASHAGLGENEGDREQSHVDTLQKPSSPSLGPSTLSSNHSSNAALRAASCASACSCCFSAHSSQANCSSSDISGRESR